MRSEREQSSSRFCFLLLWHDPLLFWNDDYELSILPVFADVARSWSEGHLPLLSPYSWVCGNLAGEFQYGTFSVFVNAAVVLIWKFPLSFPQQAAALSMTHLFVLGMGGYLLARGRNLSAPLALDGRARDCAQRVDHLLGRDGLVRRARRLRLVSLGVVGDGARARFTPRPLAISLAGAVCLPARAGGFPYTVLMLALLAAWLALKSLGRNQKRIIDLAAPDRTGPRIRSFVAGVAGAA